MLKTAKWAFLFFISPIFISAQGLAFLSFPPDAKSMALGGTGASYRTDLYAMYLNPSGLASHAQGSSAAISNLIWLANVKGYNGIVAHKSTQNTIGGFFSTLSNGESQTTSGLGIQFITIGASYAKPLKNLNVGLSAKYVGEFVNDLRYSGVAADIGIQIPLKKQNAVAGLALKNIGKMNGFQANKLPVQIQGGVAFTPFQLMTKDDNKPLVQVKTIVEGSLFPNEEQNQVQFHTGIEVKTFDFLYFRGGYQHNNSLRKATFGIGMEKENLALDYAYIPFTDGSGNGHLLTISFGL